MNLIATFNQIEVNWNLKITEEQDGKIKEITTFKYFIHNSKIIPPPKIADILKKSFNKNLPHQEIDRVFEFYSSNKTLNRKKKSQQIFIPPRDKRDDWVHSYSVEKIFKKRKKIILIAFIFNILLLHFPILYFGLRKYLGNQTLSNLPLFIFCILWGIFLIFVVLPAFIYDFRYNNHLLSFYLYRLRKMQEEFDINQDFELYTNLRNYYDNFNSSDYMKEKLKYQFNRFRQKNHSIMFLLFLGLFNISYFLVLLTKYFYSLYLIQKIVNYVSNLKPSFEKSSNVQKNSEKEDISYWKALYEKADKNQSIRHKINELSKITSNMRKKKFFYYNKKKSNLFKEINKLYYNLKVRLEEKNNIEKLKQRYQNIKDLDDGLDKIEPYIKKSTKENLLQENIDSIRLILETPKEKLIELLDLDENYIELIYWLCEINLFKIYKKQTNKIRKLLQKFENFHFIHHYKKKEEIIDKIKLYFEDIQSKINFLLIDISNGLRNDFERIKSLENGKSKLKYLEKLENLQMNLKEIEFMQKENLHDAIRDLKKKTKINLEKKSEKNLLDEFNKSFCKIIDLKPSLVKIHKLNSLKEKINNQKINFFSMLKNNLINKLDKQKLEDIKKIRIKIKNLIQRSEFLKAQKEIKKALKYTKKEGFNNMAKKFEKDLQLNKHMEIKKKVVELGSQFNRLLVSEIAEDCDICSEKDEKFIVKVIEEMIKEKVIHAKYFRSSKAISFNLQANIEVLEELDEQFETWIENERTKEGKL